MGKTFRGLSWTAFLDWSTVPLVDALDDGVRGSLGDAARAVGRLFALVLLRHLLHHDVTYAHTIVSDFMAQARLASKQKTAVTPQRNSPFWPHMPPHEFLIIQ